MANSKTFPPSDRAEWDFARLFDWHLSQGTRPDGKPELSSHPWDNEKFAFKFHPTLHPKSVRNWRMGRNLPSDLTTIERVLFGENPGYTEYRAELREAYRKAKLRRATRPPADDAVVHRQPRNLPFHSLRQLFKGRGLAMAQLRDALAQDHEGIATGVVAKAVHGLGGVGKTRLAIEYAWRHAADYSVLLFVPAETPEKLDAGLAALADREVLDLPQRKAREDEVKIPAVLAWLERHPAWLMILDNVDDKAALKAVAKLLPRLRGGHVLITGRISNFPAGIGKLDLDELDIDDSAAFLMARTNAGRRRADDDDARARDLANELGGLPLGLEQAAAFVDIQRIGFGDYLALWRERRAEVLVWFDKDIMGYNRDVGLAATWKVSVDRLTRDGRCLLERLAFFDEAPIPETFVNVAIPEGTAEFKPRAALADLFAYSLVSCVPVERAETGASFMVHRLVQDFTRRELDETRRKTALRGALEWVNVGFADDPQDVRNWPVLDPMAPHVLAVLRECDKASIAEPTTRLMAKLGILLYRKSRWREAEPLYRRALAMDEASYGADHPQVATDLNNLALLLNTTNRLAEAEPMFRRALAINEARYGANHHYVAPHLNSLAGLLRDTDRRLEAEPLFRRALAIDEARYGPNHPNVANRLNNLALLLSETNQLPEAEPLVRRALAIDEATYGSNHPTVGTHVSNLAGLLSATGRFPEAELLYRRALAIKEASYEADHPEVAIALNNLALLLGTTNGRAEAELLYRRALAIDEANYGLDHPKVATRLSNLALLLCDTKRQEVAEPLFQRALEIDEASYGPDHLCVANRLNNLAGLLNDTNRREQAEPLLRRALAIEEASCGPNHPNVAINLNNLAMLLNDTDRWGQAEPLFRGALEILGQFLKDTGHEHPHFKPIRANYARVLFERGWSEGQVEAAVNSALGLKC